MEIATLVGGQPTNKDFRSADRLPADQLERVTAEHVWQAVQKLLAGYSNHSFGSSTDYDLVAEGGIRLPPKAVFGIAASMALDFDVQPRHFSAGIGTPCFRILERSGYEVVAKGEPGALPEAPPPPEDQEWTEGKQRLILHLRRERAKGLSQAKKTAFKREHGRLFCERCKMDPSERYGEDIGEACIEVHHREVQVKDMTEGHSTTFDDLECLCANCHRVTHRLLKQASEGRAETRQAMEVSPRRSPTAEPPLI
jgi:5-methylcytosine-specific restriction protein A